MESKRIHYLSLASVVSALAVVMLHTNGVFWTYSEERYWITANIIESVMYFAVPVFFMISGATLLDYRKKYTTKEYFKKRFNKAVVPFLAWSFIGVIYVRLNKWGIDIPTSWDEVVEIIYSVINVKVISFYWFFVPLFGVYLSIPLFAAVQQELKMKVFKGLAAVAFAIDIIIPFLCSVLQINYTNRFSVDVASGYLFFVLVGYIISRERITKKCRIIIYILGIVGLLMHMLGTYHLSTDAGAIISTYKGYLNLPSVLYSIAVFVVIKQIVQKITNEKVLSVIELLSQYTFAVYLMHWFVIDLIKKIFSPNVYSIIYRVGTPILVYFVCMLLARCVRKIPIIKNILP